MTKLNDAEFLEIDEDVKKDNRMMKFFIDTNNLIDFYRKYSIQYKTTPIIPLYSIPSGIGCTAFFVNRIKTIKDSVLVVATKQDFEIIARDYGNEIRHKMCIFNLMETKLKGRHITDIYFDNPPKNILLLEIQKHYMPNLSKSGVIVDARQDRRIVAI